MAKDAVDKLRKRREKLEAELATLQAQEQTEAQRRREIAGRAVLDHAAKHPAFREQLDRVLDAELAKRRERRLFGLPDSADRERRQPDETPAMPEAEEEQVRELQPMSAGP